MDIQQFKQLPLMGIVRGAKLSTVDPLIDAVVASGLKTLEFTFNTPDAASLIKRAARRAGGELSIGAGTVMDLQQLRQALDAGATFIVSPVFVPEVVKYCRRRKCAVFPGALTPQEIYAAYRAGATMVKVFPAKFFGPAYIKEIKGPFSEIELLACGGVATGTIKDFFTQGASAVAFGASIFKPEWLKSDDFANITQGLAALVSVYKGDNL